MAFELNTVYRQAVLPDAGDYRLPLDSMLDAGALDCSAWQVLTGPMAGCANMTSRWRALDDMANWMAAIQPRMAPGGDLHDQAVKSTLVTRVLWADVFEAGSHDGIYVAATRASMSAMDTELLERGTALAMQKGTGGVRMLSAIAGGEWTGQYLAVRFAASLDAFPAGADAARADSTWATRAAESGYQPLSSTYLRRIARGGEPA